MVSMKVKKNKLNNPPSRDYLVADTGGFEESSIPQGAVEQGDTS